MQFKGHKFPQLMSAVGSPDWYIYSGGWSVGVPWLTLATLSSTHDMYTVDIIMV